MRTPKRSLMAVSGLAALALVATACGSSAGSSGSSNSGSSGSVSLASGVQGINPGTGAPKKGGTLNMLGVGDVDYMDYNISYYTIGVPGPADVGARPVRVPGHSGQDHDAGAGPGHGGPGRVSNGGETYTVTIRIGRAVEHHRRSPRSPARMRCSA